MWIFLIRDQNVQNFIQLMDKVLKMIKLHVIFHKFYSTTLCTSNSNLTYTTKIL
jgi:hypothetical protein